jgi:hypothetical protein
MRLHDLMEGTMCIRTLVLSTLTAVTLCSTGLAAPAAKSPIKLALQASDMPANLHKSILAPPKPTAASAAELAPLGVKGLKGAHYKYTWPADPKATGFLGSSDKEWSLGGDVFVAPDPAGARKLFELGKRARVGFFADFPGSAQDHVKLKLPAYGEAQFGLFTAHRAGAQAIVFVRKGSVVWQMRIQPVSAKWKVTQAQLVAELRRYALKQKARVGSG